MNFRSATVIAAMAAAPLCAGAQNVQYSLTDLGTLGGVFSSGYGLDSNGEVTGYSRTASNQAHAFLYASGAMQDLGTLGGSWSSGAGINSSGQITGDSGTPGDTADHAFLYSSGTMQDLGTLGGTSSAGSGINSSGQVTGYAYISGDAAAHAFLYTNGSMQDLGTLGGTFSLGTGINSTGQVTGYSSTSSYANHAFLYANGAMQDLGTLGGTSSIGTGINSSGQVTGYSLTPGNAAIHAFLYTNGSMQDLGTLGGSLSEGTAVNDTGDVTGYSYTGSYARHAFIYSGGTMRDLNGLIDPSSPLAPYVTLSEGRAIDDSGAIVANGVDSRTFQTHAYLLTPPQGVADCAHVGNVAPLLDVVLSRRTSRPDDAQASFTASQAEPGIICIDNGVDGAPQVTAAWAYLNANAIVGPDDFNGDASNPQIQVRVNLLQQNELAVRLASKPGAEIRVRVFKALPVNP